jgi:hypothetical protein
MTAHELTQALIQQLEARQRTVPAWLQDLLQLGPRLEECPPIPYRPNRNMLTEFLARWLKSAGFSQEECLAWLDPYCLVVLGPYSHSGRSAIRHGTKANVRWVYSSDFVFDFEAMAQEPPEAGHEQSAPYISMLWKWYRALEQEKKRKRESYVPPVFPVVLPVKVRFREQYEKGVAVAVQKRSEGMKLFTLAQYLNEQGWKTKTGRAWTPALLSRALAEKEQTGAFPPAPPVPPTEGNPPEPPVPSP